MEVYYQSPKIMLLDEVLARKMFEDENPGVDFNEYLKSEGQATAKAKVKKVPVKTTAK